MNVSGAENIERNGGPVQPGGPLTTCQRRLLPEGPGLLIDEGMGRIPAGVIVTVLASTACAAKHEAVLWPSPMPVVQMAGLCDTIGNSAQCARAIESHQLGLTPGVSRTRAGLCFQRTNAPPICQRDDSTGQFPSWFYYVGTLSRPHYHILWRQFAEGNGIRVINAATGHASDLDDIPVPSPDARWLAVASCDLIAQYNPNELSIWRVDPDSLVEVWRLKPDGWGPAPPTWLNKQTVEFVRVRYDEDSERQLDSLFTVKRVGSKWVPTVRPLPAKGPWQQEGWNPC
jgi:hypothetical protein